jgi:hypothetical protein
MTPDETQKAHRQFAAEANNRAWDLAAQATRTPADDKEMLLAAYAAAHHWSKVGTPLNHMRAELTLAHVHAQLGQGGDSFRYAQNVLDFCAHHTCEDWDKAFAHAEMALAAAHMNDHVLHRHHYALAEKQGHAIQDKEDRDVFLAEFARIPVPRA